MYEFDEIIMLDIGCGANKQKGFIGMDIRNLPEVDIVHNLVDFPWPLRSKSVSVVAAAHVLEHIEPKYSIGLLDEIWRVLIPDGKFLASMPYAGSVGFWQDPTHVNGWIEVTFQYFDPDYPLYQIYKPLPWRIEKGFPVWQATGNMEVILNKREKEKSDTLGISVAEGVTAKEVIG